MKEVEKREIPFSPPDITTREIENVIEVLYSGWITTGPKTKYFEEKIADYCHTNRAVCLNSATACMETTLRILGVGPGDEVIVPAYTYTASASVVAHVGATLVLVDSSVDSYEMDYDKMSEAITEKTKVVIPVDLAGVMCDYDRIFEILEEKKHLYHPRNDKQALFDRVIVLADAAHSFGAIRKGKHSGEVADFTSFSFHAVKNLTTGEGGSVTWRDRIGLDNEKLYNDYMLASLHGQSKDALAKTKKGSWEYDIVTLGYKCNMTDIVSSIGLAQLSRYADLLAKRRHIIELYNRGLSSLPMTFLQHFGSHYSSSGHLYLTRLVGKDETYRNHVITQLAEEGISSNVHYKPLPMHTAYKQLGFKIEDYPHAYHLYQNEITLPLHTALNFADVDYIIENLKRILKDETR